jgi:hypothetical protein
VVVEAVVVELMEVQEVQVVAEQLSSHTLAHNNSQAEL